MTKSQAVQAFASIGVDIGKEIFHLVGFDLEGKIALRKKVKRLALEQEFQKLAPSIVGMEACLSAHFVSRMLDLVITVASYASGQIHVGECKLVRAGIEKLGLKDVAV